VVLSKPWGRQIGDGQGRAREGEGCTIGRESGAGEGWSRRKVKPGKKKGTRVQGGWWRRSHANSIYFSMF
jgi:hypothetical protein